MRPCNQCGKCCLRYGGGNLVAEQHEIDAWEEHRPDIFAFVSHGKIWCAPGTNHVLDRCPWLEGQSPPYTCAIYFDRPEDCRSYPGTLNDMVRDECEMLELKDLARPETARITLENFR